MPITQSEIETLFTYHPPTGNQVDRYRMIRDAIKGAARIVVTCTPESKEQSLAVTKLSEACMHANAAIARREAPVPSEFSEEN